MFEEETEQIEDFKQLSSKEADNFIFIKTYNQMKDIDKTLLRP